MAAGALYWLNVEKLKPLKGRNIILFPDTSVNGKAFDLWSKVADEATKQGLNVVVSDMLEKNCTDEEKIKGFDIADYLIDRLGQPKVNEKPIIEDNEPIEPTQQQSALLSDLINANPVLGKLVDVFDCIEVER